LRTSFLARKTHALLAGVLAILLASWLWPAASPMTVYAEPDYSVAPHVIAPSAMLINMDSGEVLFEKDADSQHEPASMTKMMTGLLAIENLSPEEIVTIDWETQNVEETQIWLRAGEEISVDNLLYATLVSSANDAAVALAKAVSGSVPDFAVAMNARAQQIGTTATTYVNPNGLHDEGHVTTARDLIMIAQECMKNQRFRLYVSTAAYTIPETNLYPVRELTNTNQMLWNTEDRVRVYGEWHPIRYEGTTGVKTGFTYQAGQCLLATATRDGNSYMAVVLGDEPETTDVYQDMITLFEYAFNGWRNVTLFEGDLGTDIPLVRGVSETVRATPLPDGSRTLLLKLSDADALRYEYEVPDKLRAPVEAGTEIGVCRAYIDNIMVGKTGLVLAESVLKEPNLFERIGIATQDLSFGLKLGALVIALLIVVLIVILVVHTARRNRGGRNFKWGSSSSHFVTRVRRLK